MIQTTNIRLNKVGSFSMQNLGQSKSVISDFMKKKKKEDGSSFEEGMLKLLRTLPKVLKYLPSDKAADARNFMMSFQYWLGGSPENVQVLACITIHSSAILAIACSVEYRFASVRAVVKCVVSCEACEHHQLDSLQPSPLQMS
jgi:Domain of unknown function (DUF3479)